MAANRYRPHNDEEYKKLLEWAAGADSILEVGSRYGYTLMDFAGGMSGKRIVSVDLPGDTLNWGHEDSESFLCKHVDKLRSLGFDAHLFLGNSRNPEIIEEVRKLGPFEFIFIDGDHTYGGAKADWENYGPMGKRVVFHDIIKPAPDANQRLQVWKLWNEIKAERPTTEFIGAGSLMGIGLVGS